LQTRIYAQYMCVNLNAPYIQNPVFVVLIVRRLFEIHVDPKLWTPPSGRGRQPAGGAPPPSQTRPTFEKRPMSYGLSAALNDGHVC